MQAVTCFQCGRDTAIAPDAYVCAHCGADLQHLLLPETVAEFFRTRAHESSEQGELGSALAEAERGLTYADSSELHLLAAILAKQLGRHDRMRQHVAAIPLDDSLRSEAEWLLRSHQDRARALQEAAWQSPSYATSKAPMPASARSAPGDPFLEDLLGGDEAGLPPGARTVGQTVASVAIVVVAVTLVAASWWWIGPGTLPGGGSLERTSLGADAAPAVLGPVTPGMTSTSVATPVQVQSAPTSTESLVAQVGDATPTSVLMPTPTATAIVSENLVQVVVETPALAESDPDRAVVVDASVFDIRQHLRELGRVELAELAIDARLQGETLRLQGFVHLNVQREQILEIAQAIPGVAEVNAVNLLLRPLPTYIVQEGDTLWSIVSNIYGNVDRLDEFAAHNRDVLPSPDAIAPGMELRVLPVQ